MKSFVLKITICAFLIGSTIHAQAQSEMGGNKRSGVISAQKVEPTPSEPKPVEMYCVNGNGIHAAGLKTNWNTGELTINAMKGGPYQIKVLPQEGQHNPSYNVIKAKINRPPLIGRLKYTSVIMTEYPLEGDQFPALQKNSPRYADITFEIEDGTQGLSKPLKCASGLSDTRFKGNKKDLALYIEIERFEAALKNSKPSVALPQFRLCDRAKVAVAGEDYPALDANQETVVKGLCEGLTALTTTRRITSDNKSAKKLFEVEQHGALTAVGRLKQMLLFTGITSENKNVTGFFKK